MIVKKILVNHTLQTKGGLKGQNNKLRKPSWIKTKILHSPTFTETQNLIKKHDLNTVCTEAACPNIGECWSKNHATVMIMGSICTRACAFCNIITGRPQPLDSEEPERVAEVVKKMGLSHVVITSVDRDDLKDGGASHFARVISMVRHVSPQTTVEILTPDFLRKPTALALIAQAQPDVFNHNLETVPRLYLTIRPGARYFQSLKLLYEIKQIQPKTFTKSGLMLGLGEQKEEVLQVMDDLRCAQVDFLTLGQYLQPTPKHAPVMRYVTPDEFKEYESLAKAKGFLQISAAPMTRSSYHADSDFETLRKKRVNSSSHI